MKITCTISTEKAGAKIEKIATVELPDNSIEGNTNSESTLGNIIKEVFEALK